MLSGNILDTLSIQNSEITYKKYHLARTQEAFQFLNVSSTNSALNKKLADCYNSIEQSFAEKIQSDECLRIIFSIGKSFNYKTEVKKIEKLNTEIKLACVHLRSKPRPESAFKWENREFWNLLAQQKPATADDILLINLNSYVVETSRFNIFCYDSTSQLAYTPRLESGCLNGVYRRYALDEGSITLPGFGKVKLTEKNISFTELRKYKLYVGNSVRGILQAHFFH